MRPLRVALIAGLLLVAVAIAGVAQPMWAHGAGSSSTRSITVTGNGTVTTVPDRAAFDFTVETRAKTAAGALAQNSAAARAVIAALKAAGVAAADLQTAQVSLAPQTSQDGTTIVGFTASNTVTVKDAALDRAGSLVDAAIGAGATAFSGPSLSRSDADKLYQSALKAAVAQARTKAQALAEAANASLGEVQTIVEGGSSTPIPLVGKADAAGGVPIEPGTQQIQASVTVTYAIG